MTSLVGSIHPTDHPTMHPTGQYIHTDSLETMAVFLLMLVTLDGKLI